MNNKGEKRERNLERSRYFSENYFKLHQLCSFAHQIHDIYRLKPTSILEIGIGNGFTSSFLKRAGFDIVTVDINPALEPDICSPISEIQYFLNGRRFDLVVCCEVLEHMPFDQFESSIEIIRAVGNQLYLTLPIYNMVMGFGGFLRLPKVRELIVSIHIDLPSNKVLDKEHFWEIGSSKLTSKKEVRSILRKFYASIKMKRYRLNPYHLSVYCK